MLNRSKQLATSLKNASGFLQHQQKRNAAGGVVKNKYVDELFTYRERADEAFSPNPWNFIGFVSSIIALPVGLMYLSSYSSHYVDDMEGFPHRRKWPSNEPGGSLAELSDEDPMEIARRRSEAGEQSWEVGQDQRCRDRSVYNVVLKLKEQNFPWPPPDSVYVPREWERPEWASMWPQIEKSVPADE